MTNDELNHRWGIARVSFDQALIIKTETDRIYVAAATKLNYIERLVKQVEQHAAVARRAQAKTFNVAAQIGIHVPGKPS
jgi:hypothetical protein